MKNGTDLLHVQHIIKNLSLEVCLSSPVVITVARLIIWSAHISAVVDVKIVTSGRCLHVTAGLVSLCVLIV